MSGSYKNSFVRIFLMHMSTYSYSMVSPILMIFILLEMVCFVGGSLLISRETENGMFVYLFAFLVSNFRNNWPVFNNFEYVNLFRDRVYLCTIF